MRLLNFRAASVAILTITAAALACKGDTGAMGPAGQAGTNGTNGTNGTDGNPGQKGDPGTANVIFGNWTNFDSTKWVALVDFAGDTLQTYPITVNSITSGIAANGVVLMYAKFTSGTAPQPLPLIRPLVLPVMQELYYLYGTAAITVVFRDVNDGNNPHIPPTGTLDYRYIIIPGGVPGIGAASMTVEQLRALSYDEVIHRFGVPR